MTEPKPMLPRLWTAACLVFLILFAFARFSDLGSRPLHHDEGVNSVFLKNLIVSNDWKYDPQNYHGPSLYYFQLIPTWVNTWMKEGKRFDRKSIEGMTAASLRTVVAFAGMAVLLGILAMSPMVGRLGAFVAFLLAGFSLDLLFFSRYFIHETYVVLFTFGVVIALHRYYLDRRPVYVYAAVLSATLLFCTKETSIIHLAILALAWIFAETTKWLVDGRGEPPFERMAAEPGKVYAGLGLHGPAMIVMATLVWFLLFSSMTSNPKGVIDSIRTYFFWGGEGFSSGHNKPFFYYTADILLRYETLLVILSVMGLVAAFAKAEIGGLFLAYWMMGTVAFYSIIPYKTPWLSENFIVPMSLVSGYGVQTLTRFAIDRLRGVRAAVTLVFFFGTIIIIGAAQIPQTFRVTYKEYDSDRHPQVYAHTTREIFDLLARVDAAAVKSGLGRKMVINIFSDQYWPLPFYLLKYDSPLFWGKIEGVANLDAPILIVLPSQRHRLDPLLKDQYAVTSHALRPGVPLLLYVNTRMVDGRAAMAVPIDLQKSVKAPAGLRNGLKMQVYGNSNFEGEPIRTVEGDAGWDFDWAGDGDKIYKSPFSIRWTGYLKVEPAGKYRFSLDSDDGSWLIIDGETVIDNGGDHPPVQLSRDANLSAGYHRIELRYYDAVGGAKLRFSWTLPGGKQETVPSSVVFHQP